MVPATAGHRQGVNVEFWLVVGLLVGVALLLAGLHDRRARRHHRLRSTGEMNYDVNEHIRDVAASDHAYHLNQDQSWMHRPGTPRHPENATD
jgi:hypothetical protein